MNNCEYALEMLKQYYEDLRSIYESLFQIFKLFSASIVFSGTALGLLFREEFKNEDKIFFVIYLVIIFISIFCVLLTLGQAYRYRITQHFCKKIREEKNCDHYIPQSVHGKRMPTLFLYTYIFFILFIILVSLLLLSVIDKSFYIYVVCIFIFTILFVVTLTVKHYKKTCSTIATS